VVGYQLCSWKATEQNFICDQQVADGSLVAQAFHTNAAAHAYLENQGQTGSWEMGWQCYQWAILIANLPGGDETKARESLTSAMSILSGPAFYDGSAPYAISQVF